MKTENVIESRELQIERKHFYIEFRENERGKFLRIDEESHGRHNTVIVPWTGLDDFITAVIEVSQEGGSAAPQTMPIQSPTAQIS